MKLALKVFATVLILATAGRAAASIQAGDVISLARGPGGPGGIFIATEPSDASTVAFPTFCVQLNEFISLNTGTKVLSITNHTVSASAASVPLDSRSAWLYTMFTDQNATALSGFNFASPTADQANAIQLGIWQGMGFSDSMIGAVTGWNLPSLTTILQPWVNAYNTAVTNSLWSGIGDIRILNLVDVASDTSHKQDQLIRLPPQPQTEGQVPEPATLFVWIGLGCAAAVVAMRQSARPVLAASGV